MEPVYKDALRIIHLVSDLKSASAVLGWDQEVFMPDGGIEARAEQMASLDALAHEYLTNDVARRIVETVRANIDEFSDEQRGVLDVFLRDHDQSVKLPETLVRELSKVSAIAQEDWKRARAQKNFDLFIPSLQRLIELKIQSAELYGYKEHRYDALLNLYEEGFTVAAAQPVFERLLRGTRDLLERVDRSASHIDDSALYRNFAERTQIEFAKDIVQKLGFDFSKGRIDLSTHPFCTSFSPSDVRLTTRVQERDIRTCLFSVVHEAGHGMYEQGVHASYARTFTAGGASTGVHESQSLFWENIVARSEPFWNWAFPQLRSAFPEQFGNMPARDFYKAVNTVKPTFIRIDSDELTYNLHIILRYELEIALINEKLSVKDIPELWNQKMHEYLGITPEHDAQGCLQDIHWSFGGFGYFPGYTLGKLIAAMLWTQIQKDLPDIDGLMSSGRFTPILEWLRANVHQYGRTLQADEILQKVCGRPLTEVDFLHYLEQKLGNVYNI